MKTKIYYKRFKDENGNPLVPELKINPKGDGIDLCAAETVEFKSPQAGVQHQVNNEKVRDVSFDIKTVKLGIAMLIPNGMCSRLVNRSGTGKKIGISLINGYGLIDGPNPIGFVGNNDQWRYPAIAWRSTTLEKGTSFCQFELSLSQKATFFEKLKWLFSSGIELIEVDELPETEDRGGGCIRAEK